MKLKTIYKIETLINVLISLFLTIGIYTEIKLLYISTFIGAIIYLGIQNMNIKEMELNIKIDEVEKYEKGIN